MTMHGNSRRSDTRSERRSPVSHHRNQPRASAPPCAAAQSVRATPGRGDAVRVFLDVIPPERVATRRQRGARAPVSRRASSRGRSSMSRSLVVPPHRRAGEKRRARWCEERGDDGHSNANNGDDVVEHRCGRTHAVPLDDRRPPAGGAPSAAAGNLEQLRASSWWGEGLASLRLAGGALRCLP
jgi:hypothetical protein